MAKKDRIGPEAKIIEKPDPKDYLRGKYQMMLRVQDDLGKIQAQMNAVIEMMGWTLKEANDILGAEVFIERPNPTRPAPGNDEPTPS